MEKIFIIPVIEINKCNSKSCFRLPLESVREAHIQPQISVITSQKMVHAAGSCCVHWLTLHNCRDRTVSACRLHYQRTNVDESRDDVRIN